MEKRNFVVLVILGFLVALITVGCEPGKEIDKMFELSERDELEIGKEASQDIEKRHKLWKDEKELERMERIGQNIAGISERRLSYTFKLLDMEEANAFALPGGPIYVTRGLIQRLKPTDEELAGVLAHEIGHCAKRHFVKAYKRVMQKQVLAHLILATMNEKTREQNRTVIQGLSVVDFLAERGYDRQDEYEADAYAVDYTYKANYNPEGVVTFFQKMQKLSGDGVPEWLKYLSTHPLTSERIKRAKERIAKLKQS